MKQIVFSILVVMMYSSCCPWCEDTCEKFYNFENHYTLSPVKDSIKVGDTLFIECAFSQIFRSDEGEVVDFSGIPLLTDLIIARIDTMPYIHNYQDFEIIEIIGSLSFYSLIGVSGYDLNHVDSNGEFHVKFGIIPNKIGLYYLGLHSSYNGTYHKVPELNTIENCDEYVETFDVLMNNSVNTNYEFIKHAKDTVLSKMTREGFDPNGGYCFYVVE